MTSTPAIQPRKAATRPAAYFLLVAAAALGLWFAWLGWDTTYDVDPVTGSLSGPYSWWQVAGFVLSAGLFVFAARRFLPAPANVAATSLGVAGGFALSARADDSGLAAIGVVLILIGSAAGAALLLVLARLIFGRRVERNRQPQQISTGQVHP